jgi:hypothetical protein
MEQNPIHDTTNLNAVKSVLNRKTTRPAKKSEKAIWRRAGNASTAHVMRSLTRPSAKNARIRALLCGAYRN